MITLVRQLHSRGCAYAALAMVTGKSYDEVHEDFCVRGVRKHRYTYHAETGGPLWHDIDVYLSERGFAVQTFEEMPICGGEHAWPPEPGALSLCNVKVYESSPCHHWVVRLPSGECLDPESDTPKQLSDYFELAGVKVLIPISTK